jgi:hypothetical protein
MVHVTTRGTPVPIVARANRRRSLLRIGRRTDPQHAIDAADDPANHTTDDSPDRPGRLTAHVSPVRGPVRNALRLRCQRATEERGDNAGVQKMWFHNRALSLSLSVCFC